MNRPRVRYLTAFLLKEHVRDYNDALKGALELASYPLTPETPFKGALYVRKSSMRPPLWIEFVKNGITDDIDVIDALSMSAVLFVEVGSRIFAFTFGYGRNLLKADCCEIDFGIRVALNTVNPELLRSIDVHRFEELALHTRRQTSRGSPLETFGLDVSRDLLRAITGEPRDPAFARRITGRDSLSLNVQVEFSELSTKCQEMLNVYDSDAYKERFGWIDYLKVVRDVNVLAALNERLLHALKEKHIKSLYLAPAEPIGWADVEGFRYSTRRDDDNHQPDLSILDYLESLRDPNKLSIQKLRRDQVQVLWSGNEQAHSRWSIYQCIVYETEHDGHFYALTCGQWFEISKTFVHDVHQQLGLIPLANLELPDAQVGEKEGDYNKRAAEAYRDIALLDRQLFYGSGDFTRIEICDLFTGARQFVHVKKQSGSATLSHLFAQGTVSAAAFLRDAEFRDKARELVTKSKPHLAGLIDDGRPSAADYEIVYAIIGKPDEAWPLSLPFFSKLHLVQASRQLQTYGFRVSTYLISEV